MAKTKKCRCRTCGKPYIARAGIKFEFRGERLVRVGKSKPTCIGSCSDCFDRWLDKILDT